MEAINTQALYLYWGMFWPVIGSLVTPLIFDRRNRNPWWGAIAGLVTGLVSGEVFGYLLLALFVDTMPAQAPWLATLGGLVLLIPLWLLVRPTERKRIHQYGMVAGTVTPLTYYLILLSLLPIVWAVLLAFFDYSPRRAGGPILGLGGENTFVGLEYFSDMVAGSSADVDMFQNSFRNTLVFTALVVPLNMLITLPLSILIESTKGMAKTIFRAIYFLPVVTSSVGVAIMWGLIFHAQYGLLNDIFKAFGLAPVAWLLDARAEVGGVSVALIAVAVAYLWQDYGYNTVIFIAAQQNIPDALREAAQIDGANWVQVAWHVTLPLMRPTIGIAVVLTMISSFQVFDIIQVMTQGGPGRLGATRVMVLNIYENAFRYENMGWAASMSLVMVAIMMVLTVVQLRVFRTNWEY
jgi:ABC-type sugar transport system permease subunit